MYVFSNRSTAVTIHNNQTMLEFLQPDDFHHHLRDGECLRDVVRFATRSFGRIVVMPNLKPPVRSVSEAKEYFDRIMACVDDGTSFQPLMTLYLTDATTRDDVIAAKNSGLIHAYKLYPAGATTNSEFGVTSLDRILVALQTMSEVDLPLLMHGEVVDPTVDVFDREAVFIETVLKPIVERCPSLRIVMEHITTKDAVEFIRSRYNEGHTNIAATITAHHLLYNRNDIFKGGICPHMYCLPILKRETHRLALVEAATSGIPLFFIGTDSAPHSKASKESSCGCAGIFTGHAPMELYLEAFERAGALDRLEGFSSRFGQQFYGLPVSSRKVRYVKQPWVVPLEYRFGDSVLQPLRAGEEVLWRKIE